MRGSSNDTYKKQEPSASIVDSWVAEFQERFDNSLPEQRACCIIRAYMRTERPNEALHDKFVDWLLDDRDAVIKDTAMERVFHDMLQKNECNER